MNCPNETFSRKSIFEITWTCAYNTVRTKGQRKLIHYQYIIVPDKYCLLCWYWQHHDQTNYASSTGIWYCPVGNRIGPWVSYLFYCTVRYRTIFFIFFFIFFLNKSRIALEFLNWFRILCSFHKSLITKKLLWTNYYFMIYKCYVRTYIMILSL